MKKPIYFLLILIFASCHLKEQEKSSKTYFDLVSYFKAETIRLTKSNPIVDKTVNVNGKLENKKIKITNWEHEFSEFTDADINKTSWRGSFRSNITPQHSIYTSDNVKFPIKRLEVNFKDNKVIGIRIFSTNINDLYTSQDSLTYFPDSVYEIKKMQKIKLMNEKRYEVIGKFK